MRPGSSTTGSGPAVPASDTASCAAASRLGPPAKKYRREGVTASTEKRSGPLPAVPPET